MKNMSNLQKRGKTIQKREFEVTCPWEILHYFLFIRIRFVIFGGQLNNNTLWCFVSHFIF